LAKHTPLHKIPNIRSKDRCHNKIPPITVRKTNPCYSSKWPQGRGSLTKVARRFRVTIPEEVREKAKISVGDVLDVRYEDGRILLEKLGDTWGKVMRETRGCWAGHPVFGKMKNSVEIVDWLRSQR
jgi:AbrB family looped-hinge helix DNA binding protein